MNIQNLKDKMDNKGVSVEMLAKEIGIDRSTLYRKLSADGKFKISEAQKIRAALNLTDDEASNIFFG